MKNKTKIICFVPARSGSTRVKNKNISLINGRPLIYWTISKAIKSRIFDQIIFSSDSKNYFDILIKYLKKDKLNSQSIIFDKRDMWHSKKKSKIFDYIKFDLIKKYNFRENDLLVQMLPTCPLRSIKTIKKAVKYSILYDKNCFSASEYDFHISFGFSINNKSWKSVFKKSPMITGKTQSQSQKKYYHPNGVINCLYVKSLKKYNKTIYKNAYPLIISKMESFDLDTKDDFVFLKLIAKDLENLELKF